MEKTCFVVCPIGGDDSPQRKHANKLLEHILEPVCVKKGYTIIRADKICNIDKIDETIINHLKNAALVIADLTNSNPNVFYEVGYRSALKRPVIQLIQKDCAIPFDISTVRTIYYDFDIEYAKQAISQLAQTIDTIEADCNYNDKDDTSDLPTPKNNSDILYQILLNVLDIKQDISYIKPKQEIQHHDSGITYIPPSPRKR